MNRAHRMDVEGFSVPSEGLDMDKIQGAVHRALELMDGSFDVRNLQANDRSFDWEFRATPRLHDKHGMLALYLAEPPLITILWDADLPLAEIQLSIAHELGHHFLHSLAGKTKAYSQGERNLMELEAETFAHMLLEEGQGQGV